MPDVSYYNQYSGDFVAEGGKNFMVSALINLLLLPLKFVMVLIEILGRTLAIIIGLIFFSIGALLCIAGPLIIIGAPLCLLSAILVYKAL